MRVRLLLQIALSILLLASAIHAGFADMIPLKDLDRDGNKILKERLKEYLATKSAKDILAPIQPLVEVNEEQITYTTKDNKPEKLLWIYKTKRSLLKNPDEENYVKSTLKELLKQFFGDGGKLLADPDAKLVLEVFEAIPAVEIGNENVDFRKKIAELEKKIATFPKDIDALKKELADLRKELGKQPPPKPSGAKTQTTRVVWVFSCCGCCWVPVAVSTGSTPGSDVSTETSDESTLQTAPAEEPPVYSLVRRKLLLKNRGPEDAVGLNQRAVQAYRSGEYHESLDLAWAAIQLDDQDPRFWFARALSERALGNAASAGASAQHGAALNLLVGREPLSGSEQIDNPERRFLLASTADITRANARLITEEVGEAQLPLVQVGNVEDRLGSRGSQSARAALVTLNLPPDAKLSIDGKPFPLPSTQRTFITPKLETGKAHFYELKAEIVRAGQVKTETRKVYVAPGKHIQVDFKSLTEVHTVRK